jgi:hypothetical protein
LPDRDLFVGGQLARHAGSPEKLVSNVTEDELVDARELLQALVHVGMHAGDQLELAFAEIGRDVRMGERRAERRRMRRGGELCS